MVAGLFGMFFLGALYLQGIQGYSPIEVGLAYLPVALLIGGVSLKLADKLILRFGSRRVLIAGLTSVLGGLLLFTRAPLEATYVTDILPTMVLFGIGAGLSFPAMVSLAMSGATQEDAGAGVGPGEHHPAGGRRAGPGRAGHALDHPHRGQAGRRGLTGLGAGRRLPAGVLRGRRLRRGGHRAGGHGAGAVPRTRDRGAAPTWSSRRARRSDTARLPEAKL